MRNNSTPKLPKLLDRKIYKSGQTRGSDDDEIFQNRVGRNSTVLIPYHFWNENIKKQVDEGFFESGYIVLIKPSEYFSTTNCEALLESRGLQLGINSLIFYETRQEWNKYNPQTFGWTPAINRTNPLGGQYVARVSATTALEHGERLNHGFTETSKKGAGIRLYEYASSDTIQCCRTQLEAIYWLCFDAVDAAVDFGMSKEDALERKNLIIRVASEKGLLDFDRMKSARILNDENQTICPLCLEKISGYGFFNRLAQAEGREVHDITVTEINLFHIKELRYGEYNHRPYNLGWGHHHCNVVVKDAGIMDTLKWMKRIINRNESIGVLIDS